MKKIVILISSILCISCTFQNTDLQNKSNLQIQQTNKIKEQTQKIQEIWIDVRSEEEFTSGHLANAINVPIDKFEENITKMALDKNTVINLYCRSGRRAEIARDILIKMDYKNVINHGGYEDLIKKGFK